jgi:hypothetical protein
MQQSRLLVPPAARFRGLAVAALCIVVATCETDSICNSCAAPFLAVFPDSIVDSAAVGSTAPRVDTIYIGNSGGGVLRWSAHVVHASPWLTLQPDTGSISYGQSASPLQVRADPTGLTLGVYGDTVQLATSAGALRVPVMFLIHP